MADEKKVGTTDEKKVCCQSCMDIIKKWKHQNNGSLAYMNKVQRHIRRCIEYRRRCNKCTTCKEHYEHRQDYGREGYIIVGWKEFCPVVEGCGCHVPKNAPVFADIHRWDHERCRKCHDLYWEAEFLEDK